MTKLILIIAFLSPLFLNAGATALQKRRLGVAKPDILEEISALKLEVVPQEQFGLPVADMISALLGGTPACDRYTAIDKLIEASKRFNVLKGIDLAKRLAALEKGFNQFDNQGGAKPSFCNDPTLPVSPEVRCIVPVIDPAFPGAAAFNAQVNTRNAAANAAQCVGQSVQQQAITLGVSDCIGCISVQNVSSSPTQISPVVLQTATSVQNATSSANPGSTGGTEGNLNLFTGTLAGSQPIPVVKDGNGFKITGPDGESQTRRTLQNAIALACDIQKNVCGRLVNASQQTGGPVDVSVCATMGETCKTATPT